MPVQLPACPRCAHPGLADDDFCEACGAPVAAPRQQQRHHLEIDAGCAAAVSDRGNAHSTNEDAFFVACLGTAGIAVVADGVSTSTAADVAAQMAVTAAGEHLERAVRLLEGVARPDGLAAAVAVALDAAQGAVAALEWSPRSGRGAPACTIVAAVWDGSVVTVGWVGDSRAYWVGEHEAQQLTIDHSWAQEQFDAGLLTADEAAGDVRAHLITQWLGADRPSAPPAIASFRPSGVGRLIVCTDGMWNYAPRADELASLVGSAVATGSPLEVARWLVGVALAAGGRDNVTVAAVEIQRPAASSGGGA